MAWFCVGRVVGEAPTVGLEKSYSCVPVNAPGVRQSPLRLVRAPAFPSTVPRPMAHHPSNRAVMDLMKSCSAYEPWVFGQSLKGVPLWSCRSTPLRTLCLTCLLFVECLLCSRQFSESLTWANSRKHHNNPLKEVLLFSLCYSEGWRGWTTCPRSNHINGGPGFNVPALNHLTIVLSRITREAQHTWTVMGSIKVSDGTEQESGEGTGLRLLLVGVV